MQQRRGIGIVVIIIIGLILGKFFKNVEVGLIIGLAIGLLSGSLLKNRK
jgi:F0F1-type ATP synthase assembly protein I